MKSSGLIKSILALLIVLISQQLFSQKNLTKAVLMTSDGIELIGEIAYHEWRHNPDNIEFYKTSGGEKLIFSPSNTKWFKVENDYYLTKEITYSQSPRNTNNLSYEKTYPQYTKEAFCQVLIEGSTSLFEYIEQNGTTHYFIETDKQPVVELVYYKFLVKQKTSQHSSVIDNKKYQGQLTFLLSNCVGFNKRVSTVDYKAESLSNLISDYNDCKGSTIKYKRKKESANVKFGLILGASFTNAIINGYEEKYFFLDKSYLKTSINPVIGVLLQITPKRQLGKLTLNIELMYKAHYFKDKVEDIRDPNLRYEYNYEFGASYLKSNFLARYIINSGKLKIYIGGGVFSANLITSKNGIAIDKYYFTQHTTDVVGVYSHGISFIDFGLLAETGINYNDFGLSFRYELGDVATEKSHTNTLYVLLTYLF